MAEDEDKAQQIDTVPPPAGESDAYNAPTRVGPMAAHVVAEIMAAAGTPGASPSLKAPPTPRVEEPAPADSSPSSLEPVAEAESTSSVPSEPPALDAPGRSPSDILRVVFLVVSLVALTAALAIHFLRL